MKKRILSVFLALVLLYTILPPLTLSARAESASGTCGENLIWSFDDETGALTITGDGDMVYVESYYLPPWDSFSGRIKSVSLPEGLTSIGSNAFWGCTNLERIEIPDSVERIGVTAFSYSGVFDNSDYWDGDLLYLGNHLIGARENIISANIRLGTKGISGGAFYDCSYLESVVIPDTVTYIGDMAFTNCSSLINITIPGSVTSIGMEAFSECNSLKSVALSDGLLSIDDRAFSGTAITKIIIPKSINSLNGIFYENKSALSDAEKLETVIFGDGIEEIPARTLLYCSQIKYIQIPDSIKSIGANAFIGTSFSSNEENWTGDLLYLGDWLILAKRNITSAEIKPGTIGIADNAFYVPVVDGLKSNLESVTFPDSLKYIGKWAFYQCASLKDVTIPDSVVSIGNYAFYYCAELQSITIPESVVNIGVGTFAWCNRLENLTILNRNCQIEFNKKEDYTLGMPGTTKIYGYSDSLAEKYATEYFYRFEKLINCQDGHAFGEWEQRKASKCEEPGEEVRICTNCGEQETRQINALGHAFVETIFAPTCTVQGYTTHVCARCGESYEDSEVSALGHAWDDGKVTKEPTESAEGVKTFTCARCGETKTEPIPKLEPKPVQAFKDVAGNAYYAEPVAWAVERGVTKGTSDTTFSPDSTCTRAQVVTFLWRAKGEPEPASSANPFRDVPKDQYYTKAVLWAVENKITSGTGADTFSPNSGCTRAQVVTFLWRAAGQPEPASSANPFKDVPRDQYYTKAVLWAVEKGITKGTSADKFSPESTCTRAQIVTFLYRDLA